MPPTPRPRLLFLSQTLPYPPDGGVKVRTYHILRLLSRSFDVTALCFYRSKGGELKTDVEAALRGLAPFGHFEAFPIPQEASTVRLAWDHLRSLAAGRTYTVFTYDSRTYRDRLRSMLASQSFDLVHADSLDLSAYFPAVQPTPLICVHHDAQSVLLARRSQRESSLARRAYVRHQSRLMLREERYWGPRVAMNVAVSEVDASALGRIAPDARIAVIPNGVDTDFFTPSREPRNGDIVFVGGTTWYPNKDALEWFSEAILPRLRALGVTNPVRWVGRATESEIRHYAAMGIQLTGYVDDIRPHVSRASCFVVPIRIGGGTRVKILDAWAMGLPVVSTSIGCEGLKAVDGTNLWIRDDASEFAAAIRDLLQSASTQEDLARNGRRTVEELYGWDAIGRDMIALYTSLPSLTRPAAPF